MVTAFVVSASLAAATLTWDSSVDKPASQRTITIRLDGNKARLESSALPNLAIWDADAKQVTALRPAEKTFRRISEADFKGMQEKLKQMREMLRAKLESAPPEKRAELAAQMHLDDSADVPAEPWKFTPTGKKQKVGQWDCEVHTGVRGDQKQKACLVPWPKSPLSKDELKSLTTFGQTFRSMMSMPGESLLVEAELTQYPGFPVQTAIAQKDGSTRTVTLQKVDKGAADPAWFTVPEGYTEMKSPSGPPRH